MKIKIWGCRGSIPSPGASKDKYGGNTSCVQILDDKTCIILDGGSGIYNLGANLHHSIREIHLLLTHLHSDHIIGLGFFLPFYNPKMTIHLYGPAASKESLTKRMRRYFSPPIFPVRLNELPCALIIHEVHRSTFSIGNYTVKSDYVCHPSPTIAYRITSNKKAIAYMPDHEAALGAAKFPMLPTWTSGYTIAANADLLLHDAQYQPEEYKQRRGWGHSTMQDAILFGELAQVKKLLLFHHDPLHEDSKLESLYKNVLQASPQNFDIALAQEGTIYEV
jgi:phosphoribosyl 1,2-cyclic phosphodiesterase